MADFVIKRRIQDYYQVTGFINSGTYGRVYKAEGKVGSKGARKVFAVKKSEFRPRSVAERLTFTQIQA